MPYEIIFKVLALVVFTYIVFKLGRSAGKEAAKRSAVFQPPSGYWQELATLIVWKCARNGVSITDKDMKRYEKEFAKHGAILITGGKPDRLTFRIVTKERARELYKYDEKDQ